MANTLDELLIQGQEALATVVEAMQEDWMAIPEAYDGSISVDKSRYRNPHFVILNVNVGGKLTRMNVTIDEGLATKDWRRRTGDAGLGTKDWGRRAGCQAGSICIRVASSRSALLAEGVRMVLAGEEPRVY